MEEVGLGSGVGLVVVGISSPERLGLTEEEGLAEGGSIVGLALGE